MKNICKHPWIFTVKNSQVNAELRKLRKAMQTIQKLARRAVVQLCVMCQWIMRLCSQLLTFDMDYCNALCMGLPLKSIWKLQMV